MQIKSVDYSSRIPRIRKRDVAKLETTQDWARGRQSIRPGLDRSFHVKEGKQVSEKQSLIGDAGKRREDQLDVAARLHNGPSQESQRADAQKPGDRPPNHVDVGRVIADRAN